MTKFKKAINTRVNSKSEATSKGKVYFDEESLGLIMAGSKVCSTNLGESLALVGVIHRETGEVTLLPTVAREKHREQNKKLNLKPKDMPPVPHLAVGSTESQVVHLDKLKLNLLGTTLKSFARQDKSQQGGVTSHLQCIAKKNNNRFVTMEDAYLHCGFTMILTSDINGDINILIDGKSTSLNAVATIMKNNAEKLGIIDGEVLSIEQVHAISKQVPQYLATRKVFINSRIAKSIRDSAVYRANQKLENESQIQHVNQQSLSTSVSNIGVFKPRTNDERSPLIQKIDSLIDFVDNLSTIN